jgi:hypothetical protein
MTTRLSRRLMLIAGMLVGATCVLILRSYAMGPALRVLNPQPLPPGALRTESRPFDYEGT